MSRVGGLERALEPSSFRPYIYRQTSLSWEAVMARKSKRPRRSPAATPTRGGTDRDKAINAMMSLHGEHAVDQVGLAEVAARPAIRLSQLRAEFGSTLAILAAHIKEIDRVVLAG